MKPKVYITCGPPCSGKSSWSRGQGLSIISCDNIRMTYSKNGVYSFKPELEKLVWEEFYSRVKLYQVSDFIIDNTNCKNA
jgi:predicted kinase